MRATHCAAPTTGKTKRVFSARLYGSRSRKNQKLIEGVRAAVEAASC